MISREEVIRLAGTMMVDPSVVDHDYVLGCFLHFLGLQNVVNDFWLFKGGTSLQKCHFGEYRFSEDLDFTARDPLSPERFLQVVDAAKNEMQNMVGIRADEISTRIDVIEDDYSKESFEARIYYRGPWQYGGSPRSLQVHVSRDELIAFEPLQKVIFHNYSDISELPSANLKVYALEEVFVEKLRAFSGQRRYAIARDIFDLYHIAKHGIEEKRAIDAFPAKCHIKGIESGTLEVESVVRRKEDYRLNWDRNLEYLVPVGLKIRFEEAWDRSIEFLRRSLKTK